MRSMDMELKGHLWDVRSVAWHPQKALIASGGKDSQVKLWDATSGKAVKTLCVALVTWPLCLFAASVAALAVTAAAALRPLLFLLLSLHIWTDRCGAVSSCLAVLCVRAVPVAVHRHSHTGMVLQVAWNQNGNWLLTSSRDKVCLRLWLARQRRAPKRLPPPPRFPPPPASHTGIPWAAACFLWPRRLPSPLPNARPPPFLQTLKLFDLRMMGEIVTMTSDQREATAVAWHPYHENMFVSGGIDGSMLYWLVPNPAPQAQVLAAHESSIYSMDWHPMGHVLATGG